MIPDIDNAVGHFRNGLIVGMVFAAIVAAFALWIHHGC